MALQLQEKFLEQLPESESAIRRALAADDASALYEAVHKLVGSSGLVGATAVYAQADRLQSLLTSEEVSVEQVALAGDALLDAMARFKRHLSA